MNKAFSKTWSLEEIYMKKALAIALQAAATEFKKLCEPKVAKFKGGYSSNATLVYQSWLKDIE